MVGKDREVELKFSLPEFQADAVVTWLGQGRRPTTQMLVSTYYDTPRHALRKAGLSLRMREEGDQRIQTLKSAAASKGRLGRGEWSESVPGPGPDLAAARRTPARRRLKAVETLRPLFSVTVERRVLDLRSPGSLIEAALDRGSVIAGGRTAPLVELELELKAGPPEALFALARRLQLAFPVVLSNVTKADRGFALVEADGDESGVAPQRFRQPEITAGMTAGAAFRVAARAAVAQIVWNAALVRGAPTAEAIHQTRVGVRRLRATLATFKAVTADEARQRLRARLRALGRALDEARDLDVFLAGAWRRTPARTRPEADESALVAAKAAAYERARAALDTGELRTLALDTLAWIETGPWTYGGAGGAGARDGTVTRFAARSLDKGRRRLLNAGRSLASLTAEARHHVRIQTKVLRYAAEVLAPVFPDHPRRTERYLAALGTLAEALGDLNDLATARAVVSHLPLDVALPSDEAGREAELMEVAKAAFKRLRRARPFWPEKT